MNEFSISEGVDKLKSTIINLSSAINTENEMVINNSLVNDIKDALNYIGSCKNISCKEVLFTTNTDKIFFGINIYPIIASNKVVDILATENDVCLQNYKVEFDSKLFNIGLSADEIVAYLLYDLSSIMDKNKIDLLRNVFDEYLARMDTVINLRSLGSVSTLFIYAIKDSLYKLSSAIFVSDPNDFYSNELVSEADLVEELISAQKKINSSIFGVGESMNEPNLVILQWALTISSDLEQNFEIAIDNLNTSLAMDASKYNNTIYTSCIRNLNDVMADKNYYFDKLYGSSLYEMFEHQHMSSVNELSLFKSLKSNGLRSIEDDLYEFAVRMKNCETEEDAMYILRGINTRLSILEDYLYNTPDLSDAERKKWEFVAAKYRDLREQLSKKKIWNKKSYGLFYDYQSLDSLDD